MIPAPSGEKPMEKSHPLCYNRHTNGMLWNHPGGILCIRLSCRAYDRLPGGGHPNLSRKGDENMNIIISGKNLTVSDGLRSYIEDKLGKLERYFKPDTDVIVTLSVEKERQKIEVTIPVKGTVIRSEQTSNDMYVSIDLVEEIIERQLRKYKNKIVDKHQAAGSFQPEFLSGEYAESEEIKIIRSKKFDIKPMYPEDACLEMELLGHSFFVFMNAETDQVNVVYKRKGNTYGLLEPDA